MKCVLCINIGRPEAKEYEYITYWLISSRIANCFELTATLTYILASCVASEMTSGVRATLLFVGHQLRPIGLPVACTVVFCSASSACSTSANMPLGCM